MGLAIDKTSCAFVLATTAIACGGGSSRGDGGGDGSDAASITHGGTGDGSGSADEDPSAGSVEGDSTQAGSDVDGSEDGDEVADGPKFDVNGTPDAGVDACGGKGSGGPEFSYIWIANTAQGTISKLDTQTMIEAGRYQTRPDTIGSPSRTSVNLSGDVAVANRNGGITKVYARTEDCDDDNGTAGLQTSSGKDDILAWDEEECVAWHTPFAYTTQRPVAWTSGNYDDATCSWNDQKLWTAGATVEGGGIDVLLLDGETGVVEDMINVPIPVNGFGAYGGAVDEDGDFWFMTYVSGSPLVEVDLDTMSPAIVNMPVEVHPYGITVDHAGRVWFGADLGTSARYTPATSTWDLVPGNTTGLGIQEHPDGYMWMGTFPTTGIQAIDVETLVLGPFIPLPSPSQTKGVSIDFYGYVWLVDMTNSAWRIDPDTLDYDVYTGLDSPYTYSDMTGWGLSNVTGPQG